MLDRAIWSIRLPQRLLAEPAYYAKDGLPCYRCCEEHCYEVKALEETRKHYSQAKFTNVIGTTLPEDCEMKLEREILLLFFDDDDTNHEIIYLE